MISRFQGADGERCLIDALLEQRFVEHNRELALAFKEQGVLVEGKDGIPIITQGASDTDVYLIVSGKVDIYVHECWIAERKTGEHVGEMSAIDPTQPRSATVIPNNSCVLLKIPEPAFSKIANNYPSVWRIIAKVLSARLSERNKLVRCRNERIIVFIISSVEALPIAQLLARKFEHDKFLPVVWEHGIFKASHYPIESLETALDKSDFAIAIAQSDDVIDTRGSTLPIVRDNVIFELGMFMGKLGRKRTILLEKRSDGVVLPSDLAGITTVAYNHTDGAEDVIQLAELEPTVGKIRSIIREYGSRS